MSSIRDRLLEAAALRTKTVDVGGESYLVREVSALAFADYGRLIGQGEKEKAIAVLLRDAILDENKEPALTIEDAEIIAKCPRISMPVTNAVLELSGFVDEKEPDAR